MGLYEVVPEFLISRLGDRCLFAEVGVEMALGLRDGIESGLDKGTHQVALMTVPSVAKV